jgi:hypothetical protein
MSKDHPYLKYFLYLNELRESGQTNMFGARPYLQEAFGIDREEASKVLTAWMEWFSNNPENRDL